MPVTKWKDSAAISPELIPGSAPELAPSGNAVFMSALRRENDIYNIWDMMNAPAFKDEPGFDVFKKTKESEFWDTHRDSFVEARSTDEWNYIAQKIKQEERDASVLAASGWPGTLAAIASGIISPSMLIPFGTPVKGAKGLLIAGALGAGANAMQEIPLQLNQITRTKEESALAIAIGGVAGAALHGAVSALTKSELRKMQYEIDTNVKSVSIQDSFTSTAELAAIGARVTTSASVGQTALPAVHKAAEPLRIALRDAVGDAVFVAPARVEGSTAVFTPVIAGNGIRLPIDEVLAITPAGEIITRNDDAFIYKVTPEGKLVDEGMLENAERPMLAAAVKATQDEVAELEDTAKAAAVGAQANAQLGQAGSLKGPEWLKKIGAISPVASTIAQRDFPTLSSAMAALSTGGLKLEGNAKGLVSAVGGTVEARTRLYDRHIATLVQTIDEHYKAYKLNGMVDAPPVTSAAGFHSSFRFTGKKLSRNEFNTEISRALFEGDQHPLKEVQATAQILRGEILNPILKEAESTTLFKAAEDLNGDLSYLMREYNTQVIAGRLPEFVNKLADHYQNLLRDEFIKRVGKLNQRRTMLKEFVDDMTASAEEASARRAAFVEQLKGVPEGYAEARMTELRRLLRSAREKKIPSTERNRWREELKRLSEANAEPIAERSGIRRRIRQLDRSYWGLETKRRAILEKIDGLEESALNSLQSVMVAGRRLAADVDSLSPKQIAEQIDSIRTRYSNAYAKLRSFAVQINRMKERPGVADALSDMQTQLTVKEAAFDLKFKSAFDDVEYLKELGNNRDALVDLLNAVYKEGNRHVNTLNLRRGQRIEKLRGRLEKYDPEMATAAIKKKQEAFAGQERNFNERMRKLGIDDFDIENGTAAIAQVAKDRAEDTAGRILKLNNRIAGLHILGEERGAELARVLTIPTREIFDFLVTDAERSIRNYVRQVSADIELMRTFGDVNAKSLLAEANKEYIAAAEKLKAKGGSETALRKLHTRYVRHSRNVTASIARLRHSWGVPDNPHGFASRAAKIMLDINTLRFMGSVLVSSISDLARPVQKYGLARTWKSGFVPLISSFKEMKLAGRELKLAGGALDPIIHSRAMAFADTLDETLGETKAERFLHTSAAKIGQIALFDYWTSGMKQFSGAIQIAEIMDSINVVVNGGTKKEVAKATEYLASINISGEHALRIWDEVAQGGGGKVNGIWLPNTEDWGDKELVRVFRAALRQENDATIITPGLEIALAANETLANRLLFQFKSFALASHTKVLMAGLQEKDARFLSGTVFSVGLGMLSYYIAAMTIGGDAEEKMMNAPFEKWLDEGIARAGLMGGFALAQQVAQKVPGLAPYTSLSGQQVTRHSGQGMVDTILGPSYDTLKTGAEIIAGVDEPTKATVRQAFDLFPLNNVFYLRQLFKQVEDSLGASLPEKRK